MSLTIHDIPRTRSLRWRILIPLTCLTVFFTSLGSLAVHIVMLQNVHDKIAIIGCILGVCVISIATGAWCLIRHYVLVPLSDIQRVMFLRAAGQADVYAPFLVEGEVGDLARTYNEMLAMLREHEGSLKVAHDNFMKFFDLSVDCLCVLDSSGAFLTANETMLSRLGYSMEELRDQSVLQVHPPKRHAEAMRIVQEMLAGTVDACRIPLQTKDGSLMPVETRIVQGEWDGKPALFGISRDISELALSEERFSKAFHISATMKAISTLRDGRFIDVNEAFLKGLDVTREEVVGHCSAEFNFFPLKEIRNILLKKFEKAGRLVNEEVDFLNSAGQLRHGLFSMDSLAMGGEPCILTSMTDITERKRAERELEDYRRALEQRVAERTIALRKSEQLFRFLFEHMQQGVVYHDADGRITMVNPAAEQILGMTLDQMQGRDSADDGWNAISESGLPLPGSGHPSMIALRSGCCVKDSVMGIQNAEKGDRRWLLVNAVPEFQDGEKQPFRVFTTFMDITARKSATEQLIQA